MKLRIAELSFCAVVAASASQALAQMPVPAGGAAVAPTTGASDSAPRAPAPAVTTAAASTVRLATPAPSRRTVTAAGSVLVLVDGVVASATIAPVPTPAPGFVYER